MRGIVGLIIILLFMGVPFKIVDLVPGFAKEGRVAQMMAVTGCLALGGIEIFFGWALLTEPVLSENDVTGWQVMVGVLGLIGGAYLVGVGPVVAIGTKINPTRYVGVAGTHYCISCGILLTKDDHCVACGSEQRESGTTLRTFCPRCGQVCKSESTWCDACGGFV